MRRHWSECLAQQMARLGERDPARKPEVADRESALGPVILQDHFENRKTEDMFGHKVISYVHYLRAHLLMLVPAED